jgi:hypothetical protein
MIMDSSLPFTFIRPRDTSRRAEVEGVPSKFWWASRVGRRGTSRIPAGLRGSQVLEIEKGLCRRAVALSDRLPRERLSIDPP